MRKLRSAKPFLVLTLERYIPLKCILHLGFTQGRTKTEGVCSEEQKIASWPTSM